MSTEFRTSNRAYKYQGRKPGGAPCCKADKRENLCAECVRFATEITDNSSVPAPKRLADALNKSGNLPTSIRDNANGVPAAPRLSDVMGGQR